MQKEEELEAVASESLLNLLLLYPHVLQVPRMIHKNSRTPLPSGTESGLSGLGFGVGVGSLRAWFRSGPGRKLGLDRERDGCRAGHLD